MSAGRRGASVGRWASAAVAAAALVLSGAAAASAASPAQTSKQAAHTAKPRTTGSSSKVKPNENLSLPEQPDLAGHFVPTAPTRLLDTRGGTGATGPVGQNPVMLDVSKVTGDPSVTPVAVVLNVTVTSGTNNSFLAVTPGDYGSTPTTSNINFAAGQTVANLVTVPVGTDGKVAFYNAVGSVQVIADLAGYYTPDVSGAPYVADGPLRLLDTRNGTGTGGKATPVGAGKSIALRIAGVDGLPASGIVAATLNVTVTDATSNGFLTVYPDGTAAPNASNVNYGRGQTVPNLVTVKVGADGEVDFENTSNGTVDVIADLAGYYASGSPANGGTLQTDGPTRLLDTRNGTGTGGVKAKVGSNSHLSLQVDGVGGIPSGNVGAVILNVTVTGASANGFITAYADGQAVPNASNVNYAAGQTVPNLVVVPVGADGKVDFENTSSGSTDLIADVFGYYSTSQDLKLSALSFASPTVDATSGGASDTATWTIADANPNATEIGGEVVFREIGSTPNSYLGQPYIVDFTLGQDAYNGATFVSGDTADSTYSYQFFVPGYAASTNATWGITLVTAYDGTGEQFVSAGSDLSGFGSTLTATDVVPTSTPALDNTGVTVESENPTASGDIYDGTDTGVDYRLTAQDQQSGFWRGTLTLTGPGGATLSSSFDVLWDEGQAAGDCQNFGGRIYDLDGTCTVGVDIPADAAAGTWVVSTVTLTNNAGQTATLADLDTAPITLTSDHTLSASGFAPSAGTVDNWAQPASFTVSMNVAGAQDGVTSIQLLWTNLGNGLCTSNSTTPTHGSGTTYSVPATMATANMGRSTCSLVGVVITDGAGDTALYGSDFGAPAADVTVSTEPDTTPPTVTSASLNISTIPESELGDYSYDIQAVVSDKTAPVDSSSAWLYNSSGQVVDDDGGGQSVGTGGQALIGFPVPNGLAAGTYTVGFSITDVGGLSTSYGTPGGNPMPGGPLTFTVTAG